MGISSAGGKEMHNELVSMMYSKPAGLVFGFHGCNIDTYNAVLLKNEHLKPSNNLYDWLGNGIYFWENSYERAAEWAYNKYGEDGRVIGAVLDAGNCLDFTDYGSMEILKIGYEMLRVNCIAVGEELPQNKVGKTGKDLLLRNLDCAVIQEIHQYNREFRHETYDSVRGVFLEGAEVYPGAGIIEKTHTQLCIVNLNCIKGYFRPLERNKGQRMP